jgi:cholesterol oxidase
MAAEHFDAIVVGSGFGGSVTAYRLARADLGVCVLERGKPYPPGSFPRTPWEMKRAFWDPSKGLHGLFDIWTFRGIEALVSSGLGGGSLIYANVLLRKDAEWFHDEDPTTGETRPWPITREDLDPHYEDVEAILGATSYPFDREPYESTPKTIAMQQASEKIAVGQWWLPKLAVSFSDATGMPGDRIVEEVPNLHGVPRYTCRLVGECDVGCNFGSKNSLDHTYLSRAQAHGAVIRTRCEVKTIRRTGDSGYEVGYVEHTDEAEGHLTDTSELPERVVTARRVILAAGALGSTYLLLKNKKDLQPLSDTLGSRFCGNGDLLGFIRNARRGDNGKTRVLEPSIGPVITSTFRREPPSGKGFYVQDGGYPNIASWMRTMTKAPSSLIGGALFLLRLVRNRFSADPFSSIGGDIARLLDQGAAASASFLPVLGMGRDVPDGRLFLNRKGFLDNDWTIKTSRAYFDAVDETMAQLAHALNAKMRLNPTWYFRRVVTVHPLGGCPMGRDVGEGVVDSYGRVFDHPGLYVVDGSAMPGPVGPNPSLTIAAFADRCADRILEDRR